MKYAMLPEAPGVIPEPIPVETVEIDLTAETFQPKAPKHSLQWFIEFFEAIPEKLWCRGRFVDEYGRSCALGHLGFRDGDHKAQQTGIRKAFCDLMKSLGQFPEMVAHFNDQVTPSAKEGTLLFLRSLQTKTPLQPQGVVFCTFNISNTFA